MSAQFSFCPQASFSSNNLGAGEGFGIELGMGQMGLGLVDGMLNELQATHMQACVTEVKALLCDVEQAGDEVFVNHDFGKALTHMLGAYMKIDTTKTDCTADYAADGPALKAWMEPLQQPGIEGKIIKNVLRHAFKFLA